MLVCNSGFRQLSDRKKGYIERLKKEYSNDCPGLEGSFSSTGPGTFDILMYRSALVANYLSKKLHYSRSDLQKVSKFTQHPAIPVEGQERVGSYVTKAGFG